MELALHPSPVPFLRLSTSRGHHAAGPDFEAPNSGLVTSLRGANAGAWFRQRRRGPKRAADAQPGLPAVLDAFSNLGQRAGGLR